MRGSHRCPPHSLNHPGSCLRDNRRSNLEVRGTGRTHRCPVSNSSSDHRVVRLPAVRNRRRHLRYSRRTTRSCSRRARRRASRSKLRADDRDRVHRPAKCSPGRHRKRRRRLARRDSSLSTTGARRRPTPIRLRARPRRGTAEARSTDTSGRRSETRRPRSCSPARWSASPAPRRGARTWRRHPTKRRPARK